MFSVCVGGDCGGMCVRGGVGFSLGLLRGGRDWFVRVFVGCVADC